MGIIGDVTPGITALVAQLPGIEKFTDDERAQLITGMSGLLTSGISQIGSMVQADLAPVTKVGEDFNAKLATLIVLLQGGFTGNIGGMPFTIAPTAQK